MAINDYDLLKFCYTEFLVVFTLWEVAFDSYNVNIQQWMNHSTLWSLQKFFYSAEIPSVWDTCGFISADGDSIPEELLLLALDIRC